MEPNVQAAINYHTPQPIVEEFTFENESVNRYVWYPGEDLPWPEIKGGFIKRCRVTPITTFSIWERIMDVPEDLRKGVRRDWQDRNHTEARYEIRPQGIFESVMAQYGEMGAVELAALRGKSEQEVAALNLDIAFCPWDSHEMPKPYRVIEEHIQGVLKTLKGKGLYDVIERVGEEMLASIEKSRKYDDIFVDRVEAQKEPVYSHPVFRALDRLERRRRDKALGDLAAAEVAAKQASTQASNDSSALLAEMQEQNRLKREELELRREELELNRQMLAKGKPGRPPKQVEADA